MYYLRILYICIMKYDHFHHPFPPTNTCLILLTHPPPKFLFSLFVSNNPLSSVSVANLCVYVGASTGTCASYQQPWTKGKETLPPLAAINCQSVGNMSSWAPPPLHAEFQVAWSSADLKRVPTAAVSLMGIPRPRKQLFPALLPALKSFQNYEILLALTALSLWTVK